MKEALYRHMDTLLFVDCARAGVTFKNLLTRYEQAALGSFAVRLAADSCYCSLLYADLFREQEITLTYSELFLMQVKRDTFQICASHLHKKVVARGRVENDVWIVSACSVLCVTPTTVGPFSVPGPKGGLGEKLEQKMWSSIR